jgi:hypothetical protein
LIACVSCFKRARWDILALFWLLAILQIEAYWDFSDSLSRETVWKIAERLRSRVIGSAKRRKGRLFTPFCRLAGPLNGAYSEFPDSL